MRGRILDYSLRSGTGVVGDHSGKRYEFCGSQWFGEGQPDPGTEVDFVVDDGQAVSVYCHRLAEAAFPSAEQPGHRAPASPAPVKANGMAIASLIVSIVGFVLIPYLGIAGAVLGIVALKQITDSEETNGGRGMAIAGIAVGLIGFFTDLLLTALYLSVLAAFVAAILA